VTITRFINDQASDSQVVRDLVYTEVRNALDKWAGPVQEGDDDEVRCVVRTNPGALATEISEAVTERIRLSLVARLEVIDAS
jgi:hypothetical protein